MKRLIALLLLALAPFATAAIVTDGLIIHLDAGTLSLNDGDSVSTWADIASGGPDGTVNAISGIGTPVFKTSIINGLPVVRFTGEIITNPDLTTSIGGDILASNTFDLASAGTTIFAVFTGGATGEKTERLAQIGSSTGANGQVLGLEVSTNNGSDADGGSGLRFNNGKDLMQANNPLTTGFHVGAWQMGQGATHSSAAYWVDGALQTWDVIAFPNRLDTLPATGNIFSVGDGILSSNYIKGDLYTGDLAEIIVYNGMLTTAQISEMNEYLMDKYAIVPEPATLVLLGLGSLVAIRCRKA